ncbi:hypothetical protein TVAG_275790 [Trichomonas vaginalis G3]|uniref:Uncharacterized protein n=1 Tax=Trichomonas vaginalis (strain ATCC PRA-98 / G3) TaxID=412133 RepID=A2EYF2_TRIV3|nr:armadillo (ARM) repeat-containing protein family [Trichomonas vaginalis G3]EAY02305.1 hypothetical protein TVAG_275790 [Trichomonas vaginalis G3]KAI5500888.1 armadillo (ARM) repeat-containing protein family [Trichomonas vaginalis G3]|eukprot:XP_001314620.1 hypothetical protein [Trichomonas vaginalis G3]
MDDLAQILHGCTSNDNTIVRQNIEIRNYLLDQSPLEFVCLLSDISIEEKYQNLQAHCIVLLYSICMRYNIIDRDDILYELWDRFKTAFPLLLQSNSIGQNHKDMVCSIVAYILLHYYQKNPNNVVYEYIKSLFEQQTIQISFILTILSELFTLGDNLCGIEIEFLRSVIENNTNNTLSDIKLFFAVASKIPEDQTILELTNLIFSLIKPPFLSAAFKILCNFCETSCDFFKSNFEELVSFICSSILDGDDQVKIQGLYTLETIFEASPAMSTACIPFQQRVIETLVLLINHADENCQFDVPINDCSPSAIARTVPESITKVMGNAGRSDLFETTLSNIFNSNPNLLYGLLIFMSEMHLRIISYLSTSFRSQLTEYCFSLLSDQNLHACIRYSIFKVFSHMSENILDQIEILLGFVQNEEIEEVRWPAIDCVKNIFDNLLENNLDFDKIQQILISFIEQADNIKTIRKLIVCISSIFLKNPNFDDQFNGFVTFYVQVDENFEDISIKCSIIKGVSKVLQQYAHKYELSDEFQEIVSYFFEKTHELLSNDQIPPKQIPKLQTYAQILMKMLGSNFSKYSDQIISDLLSLLSEELVFVQCSCYDELITCGFYCVPQDSGNQRYYIENTTIERYTMALKSMNITCSLLGTRLIDYVEQLIEICFSLLKNEHFVIQINVEAFCLAISICENVLCENNDAQIEIFSKIVEFFSSKSEMDRVTSRHQYNDCRFVFNSLKNAVISIDNLNLEILKQLFDSVLNLFLQFHHFCLDQSQKYVEYQIDVNDDFNYLFSTLTISEITSCMTKIGRKIPEYSTKKFDEKCLKEIIEGMEIPNIRIYCFEILFKYFTWNPDDSPVLKYYQESMKIFSEEIDKIEIESDNLQHRKYEEINDAYCSVLSGWISVYKREIPIPIEISIELINLLFDLAESNFVCYEQFAGMENSINILLALIIHKNIDLLPNLPELVERFYKIMFVNESATKNLWMIVDFLLDAMARTPDTFIMLGCSDFFKMLPYWLQNGQNDDENKILVEKLFTCINTMPFLSKEYEEFVISEKNPANNFKFLRDAKLRRFMEIHNTMVAIGQEIKRLQHQMQI